MAVSNAVTQSAVARVVGIDTIFRDLRAGQVQFLPQRVIVVGQGNDASTYATTKRQVTSALEAGQLYGFGSPIHAVMNQLLPVNGDGVQSIPVTVYPLDAGSSAATAAGEIEAAGTSTRQFTGRVRVGGVLSNEFVIPDGTAAAAIGTIIESAVDAILDMPVIASSTTDTVTLTAKWEGATGNDLNIELIDVPTDAGVTFTITAMSGGAVDPDVNIALNQIGDVWESLVVNAACLYNSATTLDIYSTFNEGRWNPLVRRPLTVVSATAETTASTLQSFGNGRRLDRTNITESMPGCRSPQWVMAARAVARIARVADSNPARDYGRQQLTGLIPGTDAQQWNYAQRDLLVKAGISTTELRDGVINMSDTVTHYHPEGDTIPAYRFLKTIVKLQQVIFNMDLRFNNAEWDGAPLIPDDQPTTNRDARKPKTAVATANDMIDSLGLEAIISDPATAKEQTVAQINASNPDRLDLSITVQVSGNANIISADINFGFFFGTNPIVEV